MTQLVKRLACNHEDGSQTDLTSHPSCGASGKEGTWRSKWPGIVATLWVPDTVGKPISKINKDTQHQPLTSTPAHPGDYMCTYSCTCPHEHIHMHTHTQSIKEKKMSLQ